MKSPLDPTFLEREGHDLRVEHRIRRTLFRGRTRFQEVALLSNEDLGTFLVLDGDFQSATFDEFIYHESLVHPAMLAHPAPRRVAILGGGEGAALREVLRHPSVEEAWLVDLDGELVGLCRQHAPEFSEGALEDPRARPVIADGRRFLEDCGLHFDVVVSDLTDPHPESPSRSLFSVDFFALVRSRLAEGGILSLQASRGDFHDLDRHLAIRCNLLAVFPRVSTLVASIPSFRCDWAFLTASERLDPADLGREEVDRRLEERGLLALRYYDGETHARLLALPRPVRRAYDTRRAGARPTLPCAGRSAR